MNAIGPTVALGLALLLTVAACQANSRGRVEVYGRVTFDGTPVERGMITFRPPAGQPGPAAGAAIVRGKYVIPANEGPIRSTYEVEIKIAEVADTAKRGNQPVIAGSLSPNKPVRFKSFLEQVEIDSDSNEVHFTLHSRRT